MQWIIGSQAKEKGRPLHKTHSGKNALPNCRTTTYPVLGALPNSRGGMGWSILLEHGRGSFWPRWTFFYSRRSGAGLLAKRCHRWRVLQLHYDHHSCESVSIRKSWILRTTAAPPPPTATAASTSLIATTNPIAPRAAPAPIRSAGLLASSKPTSPRLTATTRAAT